MKVREIVKRLKADGWYEGRIRGSHRVFKHPINQVLLLCRVTLGMMWLLVH
jgi:predicted RNA binding protein YcfA (HicA-like mRNA interferase family)